MPQTGPWSANSPRPGSPRPWCSRPTGPGLRPPTSTDRRWCSTSAPGRSRTAYGRSGTAVAAEFSPRRGRPRRRHEPERLGVRPANREPGPAVRTRGRRPWRWPRTAACWRPRTLTAGYSSGTGGPGSWSATSSADPGTRALAFAPDGATLATGGAWQAVRLFDTATGRERLPSRRPRR